MNSLSLRSVVRISFFMMFSIFFCDTAVAQQGPPDWAPAHGYRVKTRHIYFPEYNFYYDTQKSVYIYMDSDHWAVSVNVPTPFGNVDLKVASKVQLRVNTETPQVDNALHVKKYKNKQNPRYNDDEKGVKEKKPKTGKGEKSVRQAKEVHSAHDRD